MTLSLPVHCLHSKKTSRTDATDTVNCRLDQGQAQEGHASVNVNTSDNTDSKSGPSSLAPPLQREAKMRSNRRRCTAISIVLGVTVSLACLVLAILNLNGIWKVGTNARSIHVVHVALVVQ